jgi:hypothetical protein
MPTAAVRMSQTAVGHRDQPVAWFMPIMARVSKLACQYMAACRAWPTAQLKKMRAVATARRLVRSWPARVTGMRMAMQIAA